MGFGKASLFGARRDSNVSSVKNQNQKLHLKIAFLVGKIGLEQVISLYSEVSMFFFGLWDDFYVLKMFRDLLYTYIKLPTKTLDSKNGKLLVAPKITLC